MQKSNFWRLCWRYEKGLCDRDQLISELDRTICSMLAIYHNTAIKRIREVNHSAIITNLCLKFDTAINKAREQAPHPDFQTSLNAVESAALILKQLKIADKAQQQIMVSCSKYDHLLNHIDNESLRSLLTLNEIQSLLDKTHELIGTGVFQSALHIALLALQETEMLLEVNKTGVAWRYQFKLNQLQQALKETTALQIHWNQDHILYSGMLTDIARLVDNGLWTLAKRLLDDLEQILSARTVFLQEAQVHIISNREGFLQHNDCLEESSWNNVTMRLLENQIELLETHMSSKLAT